MPKYSQFRKTYNPYEHLKPQATEFERQHSVPQEAVKEFQDAYSVHIDLANPNALVTLAMLGEFVTKGAE